MTLPGFERWDGMTKKAVQNVRALEQAVSKHGIEDPIYSKELEVELHISGPEVRAIISHLRTNACPIGSSGDGYFFARKAEELEGTRQHVQGRMKRLIQVDKGLDLAQVHLRSGFNQGRLL